MLYYLLLGLGGFLGILFLRLTRRRLYSLAEDSVGLLDILLNSEEDEVKLEQMQARTGSILLSLLLVIVIIVGVVVIAYAPVYLMGLLTSGLTAQTNGLWEVIALSVGASLPFFMPLPRGASNYSELSILLHRLILKHYVIGLKLFSREVKVVKKQGLTPRQDFVIISGLARAGTTSIMNQLTEISAFKSLSYANMPFLLSPQLWARIYQPKKQALRERSHKDGLSIGLNSVEALEEYFFKAISEDAYIEDNALREYRLTPRDYDDYLSYQRVVCQDQESIYLAKNNNFLLRYQSIREMNPAFVMVIMFRHPLYHAASLLEKHLEYQSQQTEDPFILEYMNWLGHHEFGLNQKPFAWKGMPLPAGNREDLEYWLQIWLNYYNKAITITDEQSLFINYDQFCREPNDSITKILRKIGVGSELNDQQPFRNQRLIEENYYSNRLREAEALYKKLLVRC